MYYLFFEGSVLTNLDQTVEASYVLLLCTLSLELVSPIELCMFVDNVFPDLKNKSNFSTTESYFELQLNRT